MYLARILQSCTCDEQVCFVKPFFLMCKSTELINYDNFDFTNNNNLCIFWNTSVRRMLEGTTLEIFEVTTQSA